MSGRRRGRIDVARLEALLARMAQQHVWVIGDVLLDAYLWGASERISPEAPVPVVRVERESFALGGAGNVARNVVALGAGCTLIGVVGDDGAGQRIAELAAAEGIASGLVIDPERPTTLKSRVVARGQQMLRIDRETESPIGTRARSEILAGLERGGSSKLRGAILADYGKGVLPRAFARALIGRFAKSDVPVAVDPKHELAGYRGAALVKPNRAEAARLVGAGDSGATDGLDLIDRLRARLPGSDLAITEGARGMTIAEAGDPPIHVPTARRDIFDVQGAGDTTMAAIWLARLAGGSLLESALIANAAAGVVVGKIGTASAHRDEVGGRLAEVVDAFRENA